MTDKIEVRPDCILVADEATKTVYETPLVRYGVSDDVIAKLVKSKDTAEGRVRFHWFSKLIVEYGYSGSRIKVDVPTGWIANGSKKSIPVTADIVIYADDACTEPCIVIEALENGFSLSSGCVKAELYSRNLKALYHGCCTLGDKLFFKTAPLGAMSTVVEDIPNLKPVGPDPDAIISTLELKKIAQQLPLGSLARKLFEMLPDSGKRRELIEPMMMCLRAFDEENKS